MEYFVSRPPSIDRNLVLDAAEDLIVKGGAHELTIDAVAKAVGVTKGGIQSCFGSKDKLIAAMLQRWQAQYEQALAQVKVDVDASVGLTAVQRHIRVTATADTLNARAAGLLAALLQSKDQIAPITHWYAQQFAGFDTVTDEGRKARLAFLATEGAFLIRFLGLADIDQTNWREIFADIERYAGVPARRPTRRAPDATGRPGMSFE